MPWCPLFGWLSSVEGCTVENYMYAKWKFSSEIQNCSKLTLIWQTDSLSYVKNSPTCLFYDLEVLIQGISI